MGIPKVASNGEQLAANNLESGRLVAERSVRLDRKAFADFAALTGDAHPVHYDDVYARAQGLRAPIAHGLLVTAITALGATGLSAQLHDSMIAMVGTVAQFHAPIFADDTVQVKFSVESVEPKSRNRSLVTFIVDVLSSNAVLCARIHHRFLLKSDLNG